MAINKDLLLVIDSSEVGDSEPDLGAKLMKAFLNVLIESDALPAKIIAPRLSRWPRVIAIGPRTAMTLGHFGIEAETLPSFYSRDFAPYLGAWLRGKRVGIPRADVPNPGLMESILKAGMKQPTG